MKKLPRVFRYLLLLLICIGLYVSGRVVLYWQLEKIVKEKIASAQSRNISITYGAVKVNHWEGALSLDDVEFKFTLDDSTCRICGKVSRIKVDGISVLQFLLKKELSLHHVSVVNPVARLDRRYHIPARKGRKPNSLKALNIDEITIDSARIVVADSAKEASAIDAGANVLINDFYLRFQGDQKLLWSVGDIKINEITADFPRALYRLTVNDIVYDRARREFKMDSLSVIPIEKRGEFAKKIGYQIDQFKCKVPSVVINGLVIDSTENLKVKAAYAALSFNMEVYRDKRYLRKRQKALRMPVTVLRDMGLSFSVDSVSLLPSFVSYEEFPEKGESTGKIFFNDLKASIYNLSNDSSHESVQMHVQSRFMDAGALRADFTFPLVGKKPYTVAGALSDFEMPAVNSMLVPAGNVKVESGKMQEMKFRFAYNSFRSDGELEVNYSDLKVLSLKKEDRKPNKIVSLLIGLFVKKKIDEKDARDKRVGQIQWERDPQRGILNYWWKSVLSGIKAVYNLEGIMGKKDDKGKK